MANKFNSFGRGGADHNPFDGTLDLNAKSITDIAFTPDSALLTDSDAKIVTTSLSTLAIGGADMEIQYNDSGTHNGDPAMTFNKTTGDIALQTLGIDSAGTIRKSSKKFIHNEGIQNTSFGIEAMNNQSFAFGCTTMGFAAGKDIDTAVACQAWGALAMKSMVDGSGCIAIGNQALQTTTNAVETTAVGHQSMENATCKPELNFWGILRRQFNLR